MTKFWRPLPFLVAFLWLLALPAKLAAIDVISMYRGSCQVDTGVVLKVDNKNVTFISLAGGVKRIPRYEIVGVASYPLPHLPLKSVSIPPELDVEIFQFQTYRDGHLAPLAHGWPIEYNAENIQILSSTGDDHLVVRDEIWGVTSSTAPATVAFNGDAEHSNRYLLRHTLAFEKCPENITAGEGKPIAVIPQVTYDDPISIKRYHDHLKAGFLKIKDYEDRQRFYAVPQYYGNRTLLGTWGLLGSRYANVGSRQANFLPLVQDEHSDGPFGFQRVVRSGVSPLAWGLHEEPTVQVFYGLKADYVHFEAFFDPTAPLIGDQYNYSKGQLNRIDDRLIEKGGVEFGFDFGYFSLYTAFSEGNMGIRAGDLFVADSFSSSRFGLSGQYNRYKMGFYVGSDDVKLDEDMSHTFSFAKLFAQGPLTPSLFLKAQLIERRLKDNHAKKALFSYDSESQTLTVEANLTLNYRWTLNLLGSVEDQKARVKLVDGTRDSVGKVFPKLASGLTVMF